MLKKRKRTVFDRATDQMGNIHNLNSLEAEDAKWDSVSQCWKETNDLLSDLTKRYGTVEVDSLKGRYAEVFHSGTFNIDAASKNLSERANYIDSNLPNGPDINGTWGEKIQSKYYKTAKDSFDQQMRGAGGKSDYEGQTRLVPADQLDEARDFASNKIQRELNKRPDVADRAKEAGDKLTDRVQHNGAESKPLEESEAKNWAKEAKKGHIKEIERPEVIKWQSQAKEAFESAGEAALLSVVISSTPTLLKGAKQIWTDPNYSGDQFVSELKSDFLENGIQRGGDTFLKSSLASSITIASRNGALGDTLSNISPKEAAIVSQIAVETAKAIYKWKNGEITAEQAASESTKATLRALASVAGKSLGAAIPIPFLGSIIGSYIASAGTELFIDSVENSSDQVILFAITSELSRHKDFYETCKDLQNIKLAEVENYTTSLDINLNISSQQERLVSVFNQMEKKVGPVDEDDLLKKIEKLKKIVGDDSNES